MNTPLQTVAWCDTGPTQPKSVGTGGADSNARGRAPIDPVRTESDSPLASPLVSLTDGKLVGASRPGPFLIVCWTPDGRSTTVRQGGPHLMLDNRFDGDGNDTPRHGGV